MVNKGRRQFHKWWRQSYFIFVEKLEIFFVIHEGHPRNCTTKDALCSEYQMLQDTPLFTVFKTVKPPLHYFLVDIRVMFLFHFLY